MSAELVELTRRGFEAVQRGDLDAIGDLLAPDVKWYGAGSPAEWGCRNRKQALAWMSRARERQPAPEIVDVVDAGERIVVILRRTGEDGQPELVANLTTFRDGKVVEMVHYPDPDEARRAAGV